MFTFLQILKCFLNKKYKFFKYCFCFLNKKDNFFTSGIIRKGKNRRKKANQNKTVKKRT